MKSWRRALALTMAAAMLLTSLGLAEAVSQEPVPAAETVIEEEPIEETVEEEPIEEPVETEPTEEPVQPPFEEVVEEPSVEQPEQPAEPEEQPEAQPEEPPIVEVVEELTEASEEQTEAPEIEWPVVQEEDAEALNLSAAENPDFVIDESGVLTEYVGHGGEVVIPDGVTSIDDWAFYECYSLTSVTIPDGVMSIGDSAFYDCDSLTSVTIPEGVKSIGEEAFVGCYSLLRVTIPESVTNIGDYSFEDVTALIVKNGSYAMNYCVENVHKYVRTDCGSDFGIDENGVLTGYIGSSGDVSIPGNVTSIGSCAFYGYDLTSVTIPENVTSIDSWAFYDCTRLRSISIPASVTNIGEEAFDSSTTLIVTSGSYAERYCIDSGHSYVLADNESDFGIDKNGVLTGYTGSGGDITIPNEVTSIGNYVFCGCDSITSVIIPEGVKSIGCCAFVNCERLQSVSIPASVTSIEEDEYGGAPFDDHIVLIVKGGSYAERYCIDGGRKYILAGNKSEFGINEDGVLTGYIGSGGDITIPNGVTRIGKTAFYGCNSLTSVTIPEGVTSIGESAFSSCESLTSIEIPASVTSIGSWAFEYCYKLKNINIPAGVTSIEEGVFYCCESLMSIEIPVSVTSIGYNAFNRCESLINIKIPTSVTSIDGYAFANCTALTNITIPASVTSIGDDVFTGCSASFTARVYPNSVAADYCESNDISYELIKGGATITLNQTTLTLMKGDHATLTANVKPVSAQTLPLKWTSSAEDVATVENGRITAVDIGMATIRCIVQDGSGAYDECEVEVKPEKVAVAVNHRHVWQKTNEGTPKATYEKISGYEGYYMHTLTLQKTTNYKCTSCDAEKETVVMAISSEPHGIVSGRCIECNQYPAYSTTQSHTRHNWSIIMPSDLLEDAGFYSVTEYTNEGERGHTFYKEFYNGLACSGCDAVSVNAEISTEFREHDFVTKGNIRQCRYCDYSENLPTKITLSATKLSLAVKETAELSIREVLPEDAAGKVTFTTSNAKIVSVSDTNPNAKSVSISLMDRMPVQLQARAKGTATITAKTYNGKTAKCTVTVKAAPSSVTLNKGALELSMGEKPSEALKATITKNSASTLTWASDDEGVATVDEKGNVTAVGVGTAEITVATHNYDPERPDDSANKKLKASCTVMVKPDPASIEGLPEAVTLGKGEALTLKPVAKDADGEDALAVFSYESDAKDVATVSAAGKITAKKVGAATITVETNNKTIATVEVEVKAAPGKNDLSLGATSKTLGVGEKFELMASLKEGKASKQLTATSSDKSIAAVQEVEPGRFEITGGTKTGTATITVKTFNKISKTCRVTVKKAPTEGKLTLNPDALTIAEGQSATIKANYAKNFGGGYTWSVEELDGAAKITQKGELTATGAGAVKVVATAYNGVRAECEVTIEPAPETVELDEAEIVLGKGETFTLKPTAKSSDAEVTKATFTYESSNKTAVAVDGKGKLTAKKVSKEPVTITVKAYNYEEGKPELKAEVQVTVKAAPTAKNAKLVADKGTIQIDETAQLSVEYTNAAGAVKSYASSDKKIATVTKEGTVKGIKKGTVTITATLYNGVKLTKKITVKK